MQIETHIKALDKRITDHPHPKTERELKHLAKADEQTRSDLQSNINEIAGEAEKADRFNMAGLLFVALGTIAAVIDALS